jgi:hypothetical protein
MLTYAHVCSRMLTYADASYAVSQVHNQNTSNLLEAAKDVISSACNNHRYSLYLRYFTSKKVRILTQQHRYIYIYIYIHTCTYIKCLYQPQALNLLDLLVQEYKYGRSSPSIAIFLSSSASSIYWLY